MFYQYHPIPCKAGPGPGHCEISWGHVAGNLSHWKCMPLAIVSGVDFDNRTATGYDTAGIFTGSVTVVKGQPIATYPGEPGDKMCEAFPVDLEDPLLTEWKKYPGNPIQPAGPRTTGPLGCTSSWREASGNWTTTIQSNQVNGLLPGDELLPQHAQSNASGKLRTTFWTSRDYISWSFVGVLKGCDVCDECVQSCSDFYAAPGGSDNRWIFGINTGGCGLRSGGAITGTFDRPSLNFKPDRPAWSSSVSQGDKSAAQHWAYNTGEYLFPKLYSSSDGRRIGYAWLNFKGGKNSSWIGMQTVPRVFTAAPDDDATTAILANPVEELVALRGAQLVAERSVPLGGPPRGVMTALDRQMLPWVKNDTNILTHDNAKTRKLPPATTDAEGVTECEAMCAASKTCGAWVFVSSRLKGIGGPRCAFKPHGICAKSVESWVGCVSGLATNESLLPASDPRCKGGGPGPPPSPPPAGVWHNVSGARGSHLDIEVTFHGLSKLSPADRARFVPAVKAFAPLGQPISWTTLNGDSSSQRSNDGGWINGTLHSGGSRGPLALRQGQDDLKVRVLVDATACESFWVRRRVMHVLRSVSLG
jgi:hypothetical protein